ncbi:TonB-dependent receptor plug domain-containing protein [Sphingomonas sp. 37zxx]|uniref:TonB-dependent receptor plug domain-containing protein n=1 Tax=Sphingomonas sp. 37zxx TaxID=1550073 RepID=UPI000A40FCF1|nr:TonB-dependent receptor [Sphingomonas sp. 37zxx]
MQFSRSVAVQVDVVSLHRRYRRLLGAGVAMALCLTAQVAAAQTETFQTASTPLADDQTNSGPGKSSPGDGETVNSPGGKPDLLADSDDGAAAAAQDDGQITITGSRIERDGYNAPTPVSIISAKELRTEAPANIADFVNTLPSVRGSSTASNSSGSLSNGLAGIASVNLRSLGANRTLVLFDGQRSVASSTTGIVDVNTFPQALIERIEVVTGGASSAYGSDAVSGVINFILDRDFTGLKGDYEYGVTTYSDGPNHKISLTGGMPFADGRGHVIVSAEAFTQKGEHTINRDWNQAGFFQIDNPAYTPTNGQPARLVQGGIGTSQFTPGGLISTGPFRGTYFGTIGAGGPSLNQLQFGPTNGQWMVGGDYLITRENHIGTNTLIPDEDRSSIFGRVEYEVMPEATLFLTGSYAHYEGNSFYQQTPSTGVTLQVAPSAANGGLINAYLPTAFINQVNAYNATPGNTRVNTVAIGTSNAGIPAQGSNNTRDVFRVVGGVEGEFAAIGRDWRWDAYVQRGVAKVDELLTNTWNTARMALATDAVFAPAGNAAGIAPGTITCRSTLTNPGNGCVPINRVGVGGVTQGALDYIFNDGNQPLREQTLKQTVAALNFSTKRLFDNWQGPVSIAFGAEARRESVTGTVDPQFNSGWLYGNYLVTEGEFSVYEGYLETVFPLFKGADLNGAYRLTNYSTSGSVSTWKVGLTWQPISDFRLRGTVSRDIRAPNLGELFAPGTARTNTVNVPLAGGAFRADQFLEQTVGNPQLAPEIAKTYGAGVIFTPSFVPGFAASVDYYNIDLSGAISNYTAQTTVDLCYEQANADACQNITTTAGVGGTQAGAAITGIRLTPFNFVGVKSEGLDFEASYRRPLGGGQMTLRALATHYLSLYTDNGVDFPTEAAGQNSGNTPDWTYRLTAAYDKDGVGLQLTGRGLSGGVYNNDFIECQTTCPPSTVQNRTINDNQIAGAFYLDFAANYAFEVQGAKLQAFLSVRNILDTDPVLVGNGPTGNNTPAYPQTNRNLYDFLGRVYRLGMRFAF